MSEKCECEFSQGAQKKVKRTRKAGPASEKQKAARERFAELAKKRAALKKEHPDWSKAQLNEAIGWGKK